jgi:hypothetical protein
MDPEKLLAEAMAGEDINHEPGVGPWEITDQPIKPSTHPAGEVMIGRSVRMPLTTYERIRAIADSHGTSPSQLIRRWIDDGLAHATAGDDPADPVTELHRAIDAATRALHALEFNTPA